MQITWDKEKNRTNRAKHRVSFETAQLVFADPLHLSRQDRHVSGEERWQTLGSVGGVLLLLVAHTWKIPEVEEEIRIISARKANARERKLYEEGA